MNTVYSLFQNVVTENSNKTAIIEKDRTITFGEHSNLVDLIEGSFPEKTTCRNDCRNTGGTKMWCKICSGRAEFSHGQNTLYDGGSKCRFYPYRNVLYG